MFRHTGETRTLAHNLLVAALLSFVAGMINSTGFLAIQRLTTNVTGHFAFLIDEMFKFNFSLAFVFFLYIFFFFLGSFVSQVLVEVCVKHYPKIAYTAPVIVEGFIFICLALLWESVIDLYPNVLAICLLFAMGLQNSLVTTISNSVVRTTHLTGLFTDLGIELAQLFFYKKTEQQNKLVQSIKLRFTIITSFFAGAVLAAILYPSIHQHVLWIAASILLASILVDNIVERLNK